MQKLLTLLVLVILASPGRAQIDFKLEPGFVSLFNGKDLTGWYYKGAGKDDLAGKTETFDRRFQVENGIIVVNVGKGVKDLYTTQSFERDFHLKLEFRAGPRADSGVYIRGPQLQVRDYPTVGPYRKLKNFKDGDWNELDIVATGTSAECKCNGEIIEKNFKIGVKGGIGLQAETGKFEFRRIRIKAAFADKAKVGASLANPAKSEAGRIEPRREFVVQPLGADKKRLLLVTESRGFVHSVVNRGKKDICLVEKTFVELAQKHKFFDVDYTQDSHSAIDAENLKKYDAVFFYTTGELPLSEAQKSDLLAFVRNGKGFGGSHCATDTFYKWKEYGELIGAYFDGHPWHQKVRVVVEDKKHPATRHLGDSFEITDEIYQFKGPYSREKLKVLMTLEPDWVAGQREKDEKNVAATKKALLEKAEKLESDGKIDEAKKLKAQAANRKPGIRRTDNDYAIAWTNQYGQGRVFYTALGHREDVWNDPRFQQHVIGGLRYMFGLDK
jgi:type 1 glutamine amidotransferase